MVTLSTLLTVRPAAAGFVLPSPPSIYYTAAAAAGSRIEIEQGVRVSGRLVSNGDVLLKTGSAVSGDVSAVGTISGGGAVTGTRTPGASSTLLPALPDVPAARALANRVLESSTTFTVDQRIDDVLFVNGDVRFRAGVTGTGTVIAAGDVLLDNVNGGHPVAPDPAMRLSVIALRDLSVGKGRSLRGVFLARRDAILDKDLVLRGVLVVGGTLRVQRDGALTFEDFDQEAPRIAGLTPAEGASEPSVPEIRATFSDDLSGVAPASVRLLLDGSDITAQAAISATGLVYAPSGGIPSGSHAAEILLRDVSGKATRAAWSFQVGSMPPTVSLEQPAEGIFVRDPVLPVSGTATGDLAELTINGQSAALTAGRFTTTVFLQEGVSGVSVVAVDRLGRVAVAEASVTLDTAVPDLALAVPAAGQITNRETIRVAGTVSDAALARLDVEGTEVPVTAGRFETVLSLAEGRHELAVRALDRAGNVREIRREVFRYTQPVVTITSPEDLRFLALVVTDVHGTVSDPNAQVKVNGFDAQVSGTTFMARDIPLLEGGNILTAVATTPNGRVGTASIHVVRDLYPPRLAISQPRDGAVLFSPTVRVMGLVNDIVAGTVNAQDAVVQVNGRSATVANRSFLVENLPLALGENRLTVVATDASGNVGRMEITVRRVEPVEKRVVVVSGDRQEAVIGSRLPEPLVVQVLDSAGVPVVDNPVIFKVRGGDGILDLERRLHLVFTDANGKAATPFTLGKRAGVGNQTVEASAVGFQGPAVFVFTALPGEPAHLLLDAGNQQVGIAGQALPRPLVAVVTDAGFNRLEGYPVRFTVVKGQGQFRNGQREILVSSDSDGRAIVPFLLDPEEGIANNLVEARLAGIETAEPPVTFFASGKGAGDPALTTISGIVLDNSNLPLAGATLRILGTIRTTETDGQGLFRFDAAPVGAVKLIVDGTTILRPGPWPDLELDLTTIPGRDNTVGMPIYLVPLDQRSGLLVDEEKGGTLTLPHIPGFALEIAPGSVIFPGGSRSGVVSVTVVHNDKIPMVPNFGQQPRFIVTIQPAGARFEPPARLTLPNIEGLKPGEVTELYSFDHDLGHFVSIGPATVSEDSTKIVSNPGVGIIKAGWHCGGNPATVGTTHACPACTVCNGSQCVPACPLGQLGAEGRALAACGCSDGIECTINDRCDGRGGCFGDPIKVSEILGPCVAAFNEIVQFRAVSNSPKITWSAPTANTPEGIGIDFTTSWSGGFRERLDAGCAQMTLKRIFVAESCSETTVEWTKEAAPTPACFGSTGPVKYFWTPSRCVRDHLLCSAPKTLQIGYAMDLNYDCGIDVVDAHSPAVTEATCEAIISDLTPPPPGSPFGPRRSVYWVSGITREHEAAHLDQLQTIILGEFVPRALSVLNDEQWCDNGCSTYPATPPAGLNAAVEEKWKAYVTVPWEDQGERNRREAAAYDLDRGSYLALIKGIRTRALEEGWNNCVN